MLPLSTHLEHHGPLPRTIFKVVTPEERDSAGWPAERALVWDPDGRRDVSEIHRDGLPWGGWLTPGDRQRAGLWTGLWVNRVRDPHVIGPGDVIRLRPEGTQARILYRRGAKANSLFATERCNSLCLMCSQPPRDANDDWRIAEMLDVVSLVDHDERNLGITGGEPTLLGDGLLAVIATCQTRLPDTALHILSNGRRFADPLWTRKTVAVGHQDLTWAIPLYADSPDLHDHIVQAKGAFDETVHGLYQLAWWNCRVEIRVVLHRLTVPRLGALANFIYRNLPFAAHVALMGLEPMGFAKVNRESLWVDPLDYTDELADACCYLAARGINVSIYNLSLCVLPRDLWQFARQSISDWKNSFVPECGGCGARDRCSGFFASAGREWRSRGIRPIPPMQDPFPLAALSSGDQPKCD